MAEVTNKNWRHRLMLRVDRYNRLQALNAPQALREQELTLISLAMQQLTPLDVVKILTEEWALFKASQGSRLP